MCDVHLLLERATDTLIDWQHSARAALSARLKAWQAQHATLRAPAWWPVTQPLVIFGAAYVAAWSYLLVAAFLGAQPPPSPLFPPGAVLLCALFLAPPRRWWHYLVAAFAIQVPILAYLGLPLSWNLLGAIPDAIEPVIAAGLFLVAIPHAPRFASLREAGFYSACVVTAVAVAATLGSALAAGEESYWSSWHTWFLGDTLADLVLAPAFLLWIGTGFGGLRAGSRQRAAEAAALYGGLFIVSLVAFDIHLHALETMYALFYLPVPLLLWAAVRFGPRGITSALSLLVIIAVPAVANSLGPFASRSVSAPSLLDRVFNLQLFLLVIGVPLFYLAALMQERVRAEKGLRGEIAVRTKLERAFAEQAEQLDRIFEGIGEGIIVYDALGRVVRTNTAARRLLGLDAAPPNYFQMPPEERFALYTPHGGTPGPAEWLAAQALEAKDIWGTRGARDIRLRTLDGRELEVSASVAPLHDQQDSMVGAVLLLGDRTERNQLAHEREEARANELAVREVNQRLDTFVAIVAHDLRSPAAVSRMVLQRAKQLLEQAAAARPRAGKQRQAIVEVALALGTIERNLDQLLRLAHQLLEVSRKREGMLVLDRQPLQLIDLVHTHVNELRLLHPGRTIEIELPGPSDSSTLQVIVHADADRLGQVLTNYLNNAVRYSPDGQPIAVVVQVADEDAAAMTDGSAASRNERTKQRVARVEVRDQGLGISPEEQETIWERFQRARTVKESSGLGLGLYVARMMVELHGGWVGMESTLGKGSTFWFTLPLAATSTEMAGDGEPPTLGGANL